MNECTSFTVHFTFEQYKWHCSMEEIEGFAGNKWMSPLGDYSLHIAPADTRTTINHTTMKKYTYFAGHFNGHCNVA
jgi:hypothetical protein